MPWQQFNGFLEPGDIVTPEMVYELIQAFDERLKAAFDTGAGVDFNSLKQPLLTLRDVPYDKRNISDTPRQFTEHLALAIVRISSARKHQLQATGGDADEDTYGYIYYNSSADEWRFYEYTHNENNILWQAAEALGHNPNDVLRFWSPANDGSTSADAYVGEWVDDDFVRFSFVFNLLRKALQLLKHPIIPRFDSTNTRDTNFIAFNIDNFNHAFDKQVSDEPAPWSDAVDAFQLENFSPIGFGNFEVTSISSNYDSTNDDYSISAGWGRSFYHLATLYEQGFRPLAPFVEMFAFTNSESHSTNIFSNVNGGTDNSPISTPSNDGDSFWFWFSDETVTDITAANNEAAYVEPRLVEFDSGEWDDPASATNDENNSTVVFTHPNDLADSRWGGTVEEWGIPVPQAFLSARVTFEFGDD